jgi:fermentation-respiration switch protein FrsA (DUF1100 family)
VRTPHWIDLVYVPNYIAWFILVVSVFGGLYFLANRAAYYPSKYPEGAWSVQQELHAEDVWLDTPDNVRLHAWWVPGDDARLVTLYLHGNAGNITDRFSAIREIVAAGSSILIPDYRGYGKSAGWATEKGLYIDSETAFVHLLERGYRADRIILHGESLGSAVAVDLASRRPCAGLILEAPFTSAGDIAGTIIPVLGPLLVHSYDSRSKIRWILASKLFLHGNRDEIIPLRFGQELFAAAQGPKTLWIVEGAGHNDIVEKAGLQYRERLAVFYESVTVRR